MIKYNLTPHGVCYDLKNTPFVVYIKEYNFHFSSQSHKDKFLLNYTKRIEWLNDSFFRRFNFHFSIGDLAVFQLYNQIETRGFYVEDTFNEVIYTCASEVLFHGSVTK